MSAKKVSRLELERYVLGECTPDAATRIEALLATDAVLKDTVTRMRLDAEAFTDRNPSFDALDDRVAERAATKTPIVHRRPFFIPVWGGALAAAAVAVIIIVTGLRSPEQPGDLLTAKGGALMELTVKRGDRLLKYDKRGFDCQPFDTLQFVLHAARPGFYAVLEEGKDGTVSTLLPLSGPSAAGGSPGGEVLEHSLIPGENDVPEKIITVVASLPFSMDKARQVIAGKDGSAKYQFKVQEFSFSGADTGTGK